MMIIKGAMKRLKGPKAHLGKKAQMMSGDEAQEMIESEEEVESSPHYKKLELCCEEVLSCIKKEDARGLGMAFCELLDVCELIKMKEDMEEC